MELLAFTTIIALSVGLGLAGGKVALSVLFFFLMPKGGRSRSAVIPGRASLPMKIAFDLPTANGPLPG